MAEIDTIRINFDSVNDEILFSVHSDHLKHVDMLKFYLKKNMIRSNLFNKTLRFFIAEDLTIMIMIKGKKFIIKNYLRFWQYMLRIVHFEVRICALRI